MLFRVQTHEPVTAHTDAPADILVRSSLPATLRITGARASLSSSCSKLHLPPEWGLGQTVKRHYSMRVFGPGCKILRPSWGALCDSPSLVQFCQISLRRPVSAHKVTARILDGNRMYLLRYTPAVHGMCDRIPSHKDCDFCYCDTRWSKPQNLE